MKNMPLKKHIIIFAAIVAATVISYFFIDISAAYWCRKLSRIVLDIAEIVTAFGKSTVYLLASFLLYLVFRFYRRNEIYANRSLFVFVSVAFSGILVDVVKWVAGRYRPVMLFDQGLYGFSFFRTGYEWTSFASGHAATAFSVAVALCVLYPNGRLFFLPAAIVVAASRILLTSHFLSDVIFGAYIGAVGVYLLKEFFDHKGWMLR